MFARSLALIGVALSAPVVAAQSLLAISGPSANVVELSGPPSPMNCNFPDGPIASSFSYLTMPTCGAATPMPFETDPNDLAGDIACDREKDVTYITDGLIIGAYTAGGQLIETFAPPFAGFGQITGLGWDGTRRWLWITNLTSFAALEPAGNCMPIVRQAPLAPPAAFAFLGDISHDPAADLLWVCDAAGNVGSFPTLGAAAPVNFVNVAGALPGCGAGLALGVPLKGLAFDTGVAQPTFTVTDGGRLGRFAVAGAFGAGAATPTFAFPRTCWVSPVAGLVAGLAFTARPVGYGPSNGVVLDGIGQSTVPSAAFGLELDTIAVGTAWILWDLSAACPAPVLLGQPFLLGGLTGILGPLPIAGPTSIVAPLPAALPTGVEIMLQSYVVTAAGWTSSNGLSLMTAHP